MLDGAAVVVAIFVPPLVAVYQPFRVYPLLDKVGNVPIAAPAPTDFVSVCTILIFENVFDCPVLLTSNLNVYTPVVVGVNS